VFIGVIVALNAALMLKHLQLRFIPSLESCLVAVLAYFSYLLSNAFQISGIVSLLFCGMTMKHYCYPNMSLKTKMTTKNMFRVLSKLAENFVFIYLGINLFAIDGKYLFGLCFFTVVSL
jgi:sodium/hydrogen exchanger-like protein 6/7